MRIPLAVINLIGLLGPTAFIGDGPNRVSAQSPAARVAKAINLHGIVRANSEIQLHQSATAVNNCEVLIRMDMDHLPSTANGIPFTPFEWKVPLNSLGPRTIINSTKGGVAVQVTAVTWNGDSTLVLNVDRELRHVASTHVTVPSFQEAEGIQAVIEVAIRECGGNPFTPRGADVRREFWEANENLADGRPYRGLERKR